MIAGLIADRSVVVCCGSGGVGKTTMAATIGLAAAMHGQVECVKLMLEYRADLGAVDVKGRTALMLAGFMEISRIYRHYKNKEKPY